jgi:hypothetical protein
VLLAVAPLAADPALLTPVTLAALPLPTGVRVALLAAAVEAVAEEAAEAAAEEEEEEEEEAAAKAEADDGVDAAAGKAAAAHATAVRVKPGERSPARRPGGDDDEPRALVRGSGLSRSGLRDGDAERVPRRVLPLLGWRAA